MRDIDEKRCLALMRSNTESYFSYVECSNTYFSAVDKMTFCSTWGYCFTSLFTLSFFFPILLSFLKRSITIWERLSCISWCQTVWKTAQQVACSDVSRRQIGVWSVHVKASRFIHFSCAATALQWISAHSAAIHLVYSTLKWSIITSAHQHFVFRSG